MDRERFKNQLIRTYEAFNEPKTRLQVAEEIEVYRASICRYVSTLMISNRIGVVKKGKCPITGFEAEFLTTDLSLIPESNQMELDL